MSRARVRRSTESAGRAESALKTRADYGEKDACVYPYASTSRKDDACASASASAATTHIVNKLLRLNRARLTRELSDVSELVRALQPAAGPGAAAGVVAAGAAARPGTAREAREGREAGEPEARGRGRPVSASQAARGASWRGGRNKPPPESAEAAAAAALPATARREGSARHPERDAAAAAAAAAAASRRPSAAARPRDATDVRPRTAGAEPDELEDDEDMEAAPEVPRPQSSDVGGRGSGRAASASGAGAGAAGPRGGAKRPTYTLYGVKYVDDAADRATGCVATAPAARRGTALPCCCRNCQVALGKRLLRAAQDGREQDVRRVLESGADVNFTYNSRWTALHRAAAQGFPDALAELLKGGADVEATTRGYTALHLAAYYDRSGRCAAQLLRAGAQAERANKHGRTALHFAAESNNVAAVRALVAAGACRTVKDKKGWTPIDIARSAAVRRVLHHLD